MLVHLRVGLRPRTCSHRCAIWLNGSSVACVDAALRLWNGHAHLGRRLGTTTNGADGRTAGRNGFGCRCALFWLATLCGLDDLVVEHVEGSAEDDPFDHVLVTLAERLPDCFLLWGFSCNGDTGTASTSASCCCIFLDLAKLDTLWWDEVTGVSEVEHGPPGCVGVGFRDLEERLLVAWCVWIWQGEFVDGGVDARVGDGPLEIARGFAANRLVAMTVRVTALGGTGGTSGAGRGHHLCNTKVALRGRGEKIGLLVKVGVDVRVERVVWLAVGSDDEGGEVIRDGRMVGRCVDRVDCRHDGRWRVGSF